MNTHHIAVIVQGLFEKSDSIGFDAVFQFKIFKEIYGESRVRLFSEQFDPAIYSEVTIEPISAYWDYLENSPNLTTVYHYCDGWPLLDDYIQNSDRDFVVRWHNNTPPWFFGSMHRRSVERTIAGFRTILKFIACKNVKFWVNSNFTLEQLRVLGGSVDQGAVIFPGSRFLEAGTIQHANIDAMAANIPATQSVQVAKEDRPIKLLFVSRVVAHKGHRHVVSLAIALQRELGRDVSVTFLGRDDPATSLRASLLQQAEDGDVEVLLKGEVSELELQTAYANADVFVCFSEHEGFGMPVFEAMRVGLPVICWGRTALRELMQDHPFTFDDLDFARAIAAVRLIESGEVRSELQVIQQAILRTYTSPVIGKQLKAAMDGNFGFWSAEPAHSGDVAKIGEALRTMLDTQTVEVEYGPSQPHEKGENFVTVYDVDSYEALMSFDRGIERLPAHETPADFVLFSHREFVTTSGQKLRDGIAFSGTSERFGNTHVIFGPYEKFVRGYFAADFELEAELSGNAAVELELDVVVEGGPPLARMCVTAKQLRAGGAPRLLFPIMSENATVEFRIIVKRRGNCNFLFKGVSVRNMRQSIVGLRSQQAVPLLSMRWFNRHARKRLWGVSIPPLAKRHFARADAFRDREWWNDAAGAYAEGLQYAPRAFGYFVQLGNCLKEAKLFQESEAAYQTALSIDPDDRDANLQIGRLYRAWDKPEESYFHLLRAARVQRVAAEAMLELTDAGFDLSATPPVFS